MLKNYFSAVLLIVTRATVLVLVPSHRRSQGTYGEHHHNNSGGLTSINTLDRTKDDTLWMDIDAVIEEDEDTDEDNDRYN